MLVRCLSSCVCQLLYVNQIQVLPQTRLALYSQVSWIGRTCGQSDDPHQLYVLQSDCTLGINWRTETGTYPCVIPASVEFVSKLCVVNQWFLNVYHHAFTAFSHGHTSNQQ